PPTPLPFFFQLSPDHRPLHSFPTRRSSDLLEPSDDPDAHDVVVQRDVPEPALLALRLKHEGRSLIPAAVAIGALPVGPDGSLLRSEEHTSELQSLAYLVCRLLLEKKKKK